MYSFRWLALVGVALVLTPTAARAQGDAVLKTVTPSAWKAP